jgi:hypothetical protein
MHAVFFQTPDSQKTVVCLVNDFGWFRSERERSGPATNQAPPLPCSGVVIDHAGTNRTVRRALEAVTGQELTVRRENGKTSILVPDFSVMACIAIEWGVHD